MNLTLICQNQSITAQELDDRVGSARKVMLDLPLPVGELVELAGEGFFRVTRVLAPAAPRTWRAYLEADQTVQGLDIDGQSIPVVALTDDPEAVKVMALVDLPNAPATGTTVHYGQKAYTIQRALAPAAPRGWRFYLQPVAVTASEPAEPTPPPEPVAAVISEAPEPIEASMSAPSTPAVPHAVNAVAHASENLESVFIVQVEKLGGTNIRRSSTTLRVPYNRLSEELQRILRGGGKVVSITEGSLLR